MFCLLISSISCSIYAVVNAGSGSELRIEFPNRMGKDDCWGVQLKNSKNGWMKPLSMRITWVYPIIIDLRCTWHTWEHLWQIRVGTWSRWVQRSGKFHLMALWRRMIREPHQWWSPLRRHEAVVLGDGHRMAMVGEPRSWFPLSDLP